MNADKLVELGERAYQEGNYEQEAIYYKQASELDHAEATNLLGTMYLAGRGVHRNCFEARTLFEHAISLGSSEALNNLGVMHFYGEGVPGGINYSTAKGLIEQSIEKGNVEASESLARMYADGLGVPVDLPKAISLLISVYQESTNQEDYLQYIIDHIRRRLFLNRDTPFNSIMKEYVRLWQESQTVPTLQEENKMLKRQVEELEAQVAYQPGGAGFLDAQEDFEHHAKKQKQ